MQHCPLLRLGQQPLPEPEPQIMALLPVLPLRQALDPKLGLEVGGLRQGDQLLNIHQQPVVFQSVGLQANAANVDLAVPQPHDGCGKFLTEIRSGQDDPGIAAECHGVRRIRAQEGEDFGTRGIVLRSGFVPMPRQGVDCLLEGHGRHHGSIAQRLKLHVAAVLGAFQFDDNQIGVGI